MSTALTDKQAAVLAFMREFEAANDNMPTMQTIAAHFGWASPNAVNDHMRFLAKKGAIERNAQGGWRFARAPAEAAS